MNELLRNMLASRNLDYGHNITPIVMDSKLDRGEQIAKYNQMMAMDSNIPNNASSSGAPAIYTTAFMNEINRQLFQIRNFDAVATPVTLGSFGTSQVQMPMLNLEGDVEDYDDYSEGGQSAATLKTAWRDTKEFSKTLMYGYKEQAVMGMAGVDIATEKRSAQAERISIEINKIGFYGVANQNTFGLLTDPNLLPAEDAGKTLKDMTFDEAQALVGVMFNRLRKQSGGILNRDAKMFLMVDLENAEYFATKINLIGITLEDQLKKIYKNLEILPTPEYRSTKGQATWQLIADEVNGVKTVRSLEVTRYNSLGLVQKVSSWAEKVCASFAGAVVYKPMGITSIINI